MYVLRHDHVTSDCKEITQPDALQRILKKLHRRSPSKGMADAGNC
jgi:hypothetical protein